MARVIELKCLLQGNVGRPAVVCVDQLGVHFRGESTPMDILRVLSCGHFLRTGVALSDRFDRCQLKGGGKGKRAVRRYVEAQCRQAVLVRLLCQRIACSQGGKPGEIPVCRPQLGDAMMQAERGDARVVNHAAA